MKAVGFEYARPTNLAEACALLATNDDARIIAGGQTLVPLMAMRLARPKLLVDIARIPDLAFVRDEGDAVAIGATTRQCVIEHDPIVRRKLPLLAKVMPWIGHAATRARGTVGGSLANGDAAAEIALAAVTLEATLTYQDGGTTHQIPAASFFLGPMLTALPLTGCLVSVRFPAWREARVGVGFHEVSSRRSDFAFVSAAAQLALDPDGRCRRLTVGVGALTDMPLQLASVAQALEGTLVEDAAAEDAVRAALSVVRPFADLHASADYRRRVAVSLAMRAIRDAHSTAQNLVAHDR
jgi:CO/xanthine dehydrogenase FAD-binding subunit